MVTVERRRWKRDTDIIFCKSVFQLKVFGPKSKQSLVARRLSSSAVNSTRLHLWGLKSCTLIIILLLHCCLLSATCHLTEMRWEFVPHSRCADRWEKLFYSPGILPMFPCNHPFCPDFISSLRALEDFWKLSQSSCQTSGGWSSMDPQVVFYSYPVLNFPVFLLSFINWPHLFLPVLLLYTEAHVPSFKIYTTPSELLFLLDSSHVCSDHHNSGVWFRYSMCSIARKWTASMLSFSL